LQSFLADPAVARGLSLELLKHVYLEHVKETKTEVMLTDIKIMISTQDAT